MRIAITGGTGFVGHHLARALLGKGHTIVIIARGRDRHDPNVGRLSGVCFVEIGIGDQNALADAFSGCDAVVHCAGINRETRRATFQSVHIEGTRNVVRASEQAGVRKITLVSFLRARPHCGSAYHESKWEAEEIVRQSNLNYTILKSGMIYGKGDHMLDHLSRSLHTLPFFATPGFSVKRIRPVAVEDVIRIIEASLCEGSLTNATVGIVGPDEITLDEAVRRVARVTGRRVMIFPLPVFFHYALARCLEPMMKIPLISRAQVRILEEEVIEAFPPCDQVTDKLRPTIQFSDEQIRLGLPEPRGFGIDDCPCL
ncbi:MAG: nucleoside-diphosphate sugar epimerase [Blastocatellia bacterium AA13]|nr:MAG: nucleoside-diphosphate sugar epimerase [Blastocatellia bacterium AA13]